MHHPHRSKSDSSRHHRHQHHNHHSSSSRSGDYNITSGLDTNYRVMRSYVVDVHPDSYSPDTEYGYQSARPYARDPEPSYRRSRGMDPVGVPVMTSVASGVRVVPNRDQESLAEIEHEITPLFHHGEDVVFASDIYEVTSRPKITREGKFKYSVRHKHDRGTPIDVLEDELVRVPTRLFATGTIVRYQRDGRRYDVLGAGFLPQEGVWDYTIKRYSSSEGRDIKRNAFEPQLMKVEMEDSHLTPPTSRHSPTSSRPGGPSPKGSFSSLMDSLLFRH